MKEYKYVSVENTGFMNVKFDSYRAIIDEHAACGYRYVGFVPTEIVGGTGVMVGIDLIFEKDAEGK